jgi:hypothetical protein
VPGVRAATAIALGCVVAFGAIAVALFFFADRLDCRADPDWAAWRETTNTDGGSDPENGEDRRRDAAAYLMNCRSLHGRSRRAVRRLLGKPAWDDVAVRGDHTFFSYYLGPDGLGLDSEWLSIEFDGDGRVVRLDVVQT